MFLSIVKRSSLLRSFGLRFIATTNIRQQNVIDFPDNPEIKIPLYPRKTGESLDMKKARLLYQSRKRGMLENDLLLSTFAAKYLKAMNEKQIEQYDNLITQPSNDWDIYYWVTGKQLVPEAYDNEIMQMLKEHVKQSRTEARNRQPELS